MAILRVGITERTAAKCRSMTNPTESKADRQPVRLPPIWQLRLASRHRLRKLGRGVRGAVEPAIRRGFHLYWRMSRGLTLGVRALVVDEAGRIFLVKHTYVTGWYLPG